MLKTLTRSNSRYVDLSVSVKVFANNRDTDDLRMEGCTLPFTRVLYQDQPALGNRLQDVGTTSNLSDSLRRLKNADEVIRHSEIGWMSRKIEGEE